MTKDVKDYIKNAQEVVESGGLRGRRGKERDLWHHWNSNGRQEEHLEPLMASFEPVIEKQTRTRMGGLGGTMPQSALKAEVRGAVAKSIHSWDPEKGADLFNHVYGGLMRVTDAINKSRNASHLPRKISDLYQPFQSAVGELRDTLGRDPEDHEILSLMPSSGNPQKDLEAIKRLRKATRKELFSNIGADVELPTKAMGVRDAYALLHPTFSDRERQFVDLHYAADGSSMPVAQIAKRMGLPSHTVYRLKNNVERRLDAVIKKT
jgi:DNA-directed RNA polymerase specialized sigma subunit